MEYFDSGQLQDFSVRDVFESEVKSEIDELLSTETTPFAQETVTNMDLGTGLPSQDLSLDITELQAWDQALGLSSLNNPDIVVSSSNNSFNFCTDKYGCDSNSGHIFVDPQTVLPTSHPTPTTLGATHIHAQQVNLFVNSASSQLQQQALLQQQGLNNVSKDNLGFGLEQFNHTNTNSGHLQVRPVQVQPNRRQFTHYQLQNGQGQVVVSPQKVKSNISSHKFAHNQVIKSAKHQPYTTSRPHAKKPTKIAKSIKMEPGIKVEKVYSKPCYSYSCLITMALKNSKDGCLPVSEIYHFMCENFPYFKTAKDGWKNSVRHNLSLNKCFAKAETTMSNAKTGKKGCLWAMNPEKFAKMEEEVHKSTKRDPIGIQMCMAKPEDFPKIEALSQLTHPKNLKNAAKIRQSCVNKRTVVANLPSTIVQVNKLKVPSVTIATVPVRVPTPVSLKKVDVSSLLEHDLFHQDLSVLDSAFLPSDVDVSFSDNKNEVCPYDTVEIIPYTSTNATLSRNASSMSDISPYKDSSQSVNSRILGLDTSPITTLANTHYSGLEQASRRLEAYL